MAAALSAIFATVALADKPVVISISQIVEHPSLDNTQKGFKDGLKELGVDATYNVHIAQGNQATNLQIANQILDEKPALVLAIATSSAQACAQKIKDIPLLFSAVSDPKGAGLVESMEAPGGHITGTTDMPPVDKQLALIKSILPKAATIGVVYNAGEANSVSQVEAFKAAAKKMNIDVVEATATNSSLVYQAAQSLVGKCDAVYTPLDNTVVSTIGSVVKVCNDNKLPFFSSDNESVQKGSIAALATDYYALGRQTAEMAQKILAGAKPGDLPVEGLKNLDVHLNLNAARIQGVTVPEDVIKSAKKIYQ